ncbi:MAG: NYN domain-containing protein [Lachnospiraceae bacterium]|nr:NYN domain-containing protein [Lachnospiraceae bacterium]
MKEKIVMGILAHVDAGKTTLSENLLYKTGVIKEAGRVDSRNTFLDGNIQERERGITIYSKNARIPLNEKEIILVDTPGHVDFSAETERAVNVLDAAVLVIDASSKVDSHTKTLWSLLKYYEIPVYFFVNKIDMPGFDKERILENIKKELSSNSVDFSDDSDPDFFENIAVCSESFLNVFLEKSNIDKELIRQGIKERKIFPVFFGSALKGEGIDGLIRGLGDYLFTPDTFGKEKEEFSSQVYKITYDEAGKRNTFMKILSGTLKIKDNLGDEKVNEIRVYSGDKFKRENEVYAGEICAVTGILNSSKGMVYGNLPGEKKPVLSPVFNYAADFGKDADLKKMWDIVSRLADEDPSLNAKYDEQLKEIRVSLMGDVQSEVLKRRMKDEFGIDVEFREGRIRYKETIEETVIGVGHFEPLRHYAEVQIKIEPLARGSGLEFESELSEDYLDINWQKLVLTHLREKEHKSVLIGAPLTDVKFTLVAGRAHVKHTEGGDFRQATYRAVRQGLMKALSADKCRLLEPYYDYTLQIPENYAGKAVTDINMFSGTASITENDGETITVAGKAPASAMNAYAKELTAYTKGKAVLNFVLAGYDFCHNEKEIVEKTAYDPDADPENPSSSVFVSHGAGTLIEWFDVDRYKHTFYSEKYGNLSNETDSEAKEANRIRRERETKEEFISVEEVDSILKQSTHANENSSKNANKSFSDAFRVSPGRKEKESPVYVGTVQKEKYLLVDGYNVIHAWKELSDLSSVSMDSAALRLNEIMSNYREMSGYEIIVVYDAYRVEGHRTSEKTYDNISVVYTKEAQTADQYIERYAHQNSNKYDITVATSDGLEQIIVTGAGCSIISSREFEEEVRRTADSFNDKYNVT